MIVFTMGLVLHAIDNSKYRGLDNRHSIICMACVLLAKYYSFVIAPALIVKCESIGYGNVS